MNHNHNWHVAINNHMNDKLADQYMANKHMYIAKDMFSEIPRMIKLHALERKGELPALHRQCSKQDAEPIQKNHLTCCLGIKCATCPQLLALNNIKDYTPEQIDEAKAWTCAAHIAGQGGDLMGEGWLMTEGDKMYWQNVYNSLSYQDVDDEGGDQ